jgi:hypothetical protein
MEYLITLFWKKIKVILHVFFLKRRKALAFREWKCTPRARGGGAQSKTTGHPHTVHVLSVGQFCLSETPL